MNCIKRLLDRIKRKNKCSCNDVKCTRELIGTKEGRLYVKDHYTCGNVKAIINKIKKIKT